MSLCSGARRFGPLSTLAETWQGRHNVVGFSMLVWQGPAVWALEYAGRDLAREA